ncbi:uncharacterized protein [Argopecten irradians]|uniref:uncharacterized protein isoform X3 n=1 Tax=Argopecten irradians TaxID=31199 RepID=UPI0037175040
MMARYLVCLSQTPTTDRWWRIRLTYWSFIKLQVIGIIQILLFVTNTGAYTSKKVTKLKYGIQKFHDLFKNGDENPMFTHIDHTKIGFTDSNLFKKDREDILYSTSDENTCKPSTISITSELKDSSVCPWYTKMGYDNKRIPQTIHIAECLCESCAEGCCREVYIDLPVLRSYRGEYVPTLEPVSVACVCQHMSVRDQHIHCRKGKTFKPGQDSSTLQERRRVNQNTHRQSSKNEMTKLKTRSSKRVYSQHRQGKTRRDRKLRHKKGRRRKHKRRKSNVTRLRTRELVWWRDKNCAYYSKSRFSIPSLSGTLCV